MEEVDAIILPRKEDLVFWLILLVAVIVLLLWDLRKASNRRAPWIPGDAFMLNAIIIQSLSFIDYSHVRVYSGSRYQTKEVVAILVKNQLVIDSGRVMMCVLIAYLLPGMARSGSITDGCNLAALALSIISDVVSELWFIWKVEKRNDSSSALAASSFAIILIAAIIYLLWLLFKAISSGKNSCRIRSERVPSALSCYDRPRYDDIKDDVLKCWLAARLYQPDYVFVRTGLCSTAFIVVTVCIGVDVIKQIYLPFTDNESLNSVTKSTLVHFVIFGQRVIVLIGWIVLLVRWATYADISLSPRNAWRCVEELSTVFAPLAPDHGRPTGDVDDDEFPLYQSTLETLLLPGENSRSPWKANQSGFRNVKRYLVQEDGRRISRELTDLLIRLGTTTAEDADARGKAEQLQRANRNSWKRTAVSLIHFMIYYYEGSDDFVIGKAMQCYTQGWEYMDFVDGLNEEVKSLGPQANEEFNSLQRSWNKKPRRLETEIKEPLRQLRARWHLQNSLSSTEVAECCLFNTGEVIDPYLLHENNKIAWLQRVLASVYDSYMTQGLNQAVLQKCRELAKEGMEEEIVDVAILSAKAQGVLKQVREGRNTAQASTSSRVHFAEPVREGHNTDQASTSSPIQTDQLLSVTVTETETEPEPEPELVGEGNGQAELQLIRSRRHNEGPYETGQNYIAAFGEGNGQAELPPIHPHRLVQTTIHVSGHGNQIRLHRPNEIALIRMLENLFLGRLNDSLTNQTEIAAVREGHNTDQGSDTSSIQTEDEEVGEGNGQAELQLIRSRRHNEGPYETGQNYIAERPAGLRRRKGHNTDQASTSSPIQTETELKVIGNDHEDDAIDDV